MTNPGGIRTDLLYNQISGGEAPGQVTYAEAFAVQPFSNSLVTMTLTGAQLKTVLEQQFVGCGQPTDGQKILQVSAGFTYSWSSAAPACSKIDPATIKLNAVTIDPNASYRVTINNFLAGGGDNFLGFKAGTDLLTGMIDLDSFTAYLTANSPVAPGPQNRITLIP
jgi:5'-nucleotidase